MANPNIPLSNASTHVITDPPIRTSVSEWYSSSSGCGSLSREAALVVPSALLILYLGFQARRNVKKLSHRKSYVMIAYYALLWFSTLLNMAWSMLQKLTQVESVKYHIFAKEKTKITLKKEYSILTGDSWIVQTLTNME